MPLETTPYLAGLTDTLSGPVGIAFSLTLLGALTMGSLRSFKRAAMAERAKPTSTSDLARELLIPVARNDPDLVAHAAVANRVSDLFARCEWAQLSREISIWERRLDATPGGTRHHDIAIETCLMPLQACLDDASRNSLDDLSDANDLIADYVARHNEAPEDPVHAVLAACAHMLVADNCRAEFWPEREKSRAWRHMAQHYLRAEVILSRFDPVAHMSPLLASAYYELALGMPDGAARLKHAFEDWIDLDPSNPAIYAVHIPQLFKDGPVSLSTFKAEVAKAEARTAETLGKGGYALCALPALADCPELRDHVDAARLAAGLTDLARLSGTQADVNWAAATLLKEGTLVTGDRRDVYRDAFDTLVRRHLGVIYPRLWHIPLDQIRANLADTFERTGAPKITENPDFPVYSAKAA
ncbi:hypothetical protein [Boseongicola aestuarii]|uniref:DUF4034 domain-containing protein n=1 Tax=Boseongicola aestuarii TaxID=1470561 RepID=A0A238J2A3_9RHOB|nr:hypothetical protein [Boseongicola aestuarii]SMX24796.1 hypothetical protein BOA8489_02925 [Boseongicola aestuarii]